MNWWRTFSLPVATLRSLVRSPGIRVGLPTAPALLLWPADPSPSEPSHRTVPKLSSEGAARLEAATASLLAPPDSTAWPDRVRLAFRSLLRADAAAVVIGRGDELHFFGDDQPVALLRHTHERSGATSGPIFQRGFWLHSGPRHAGADPRPHDAVGVCDLLDARGGFVGACCTFADALAPTTSRARLRLLKAIRPAFTASARQQLGRLAERSELAAMLEVVGDAAALVSPSGEIVHVSSQLRSLLDAEGPERPIRGAIAALAAGATCLSQEPKAAGDSRCSAELRSGAGNYTLRCCPMPGDAAAGRRLILVTLNVQRPAELPTAADLVRQFGLTPRECDVAFQLQAGKSNAEVAEALGISAFTARHHTERVLTKLGVRTRASVPAALRKVAAAVAAGAPLPVRSLGERRRQRPGRDAARAAAAHAAGANNGSRRPRVEVAAKLAATPAAPRRRTLPLTDEPARWHYDQAIGDSAAPIAPRAD